LQEEYLSHAEELTKGRGESPAGGRQFKIKKYMLWMEGIKWSGRESCMDRGKNGERLKFAEGVKLLFRSVLEECISKEGTGVKRGGRTDAGGQWKKKFASGGANVQCSP